MSARTLLWLGTVLMHGAWAAEPVAPPAAPAGADEPDAPSDARPVARTPAPADHMTLDPTAVTGNRELPKVLYIVPWKKARPGDLERPVHSLIDEVLAPVDREVFRREVRYFQDISATQSAVATEPASDVPAPAPVDEAANENE